MAGLLATVQDGEVLVTFDVIPPRDNYRGMTRLALEGKRALSCMGTGPEVEQAIRDRLEELKKQPYSEEDGR